MPSACVAHGAPSRPSPTGTHTPPRQSSPRRGSQSANASTAHRSPAARRTVIAAQLPGAAEGPPVQAARAFAHIDRLTDRGALADRPDDRPVDNPAHRRLAALEQELEAEWVSLTVALSSPSLPRPRAEILLDRDVNAVQSAVVARQKKETPAKVERRTIDPEARRTSLTVRNRLLLLPLKNALENSRRWLSSALGSALSPTDHVWDQDTRLRTLTALLRAPGTVSFGEDAVEVVLHFPLAPTAHRRLTAALAQLDTQALRFVDGDRAVRFRLAPRPTRAAADGAESSG